MDICTYNHVRFIGMVEKNVTNNSSKETTKIHRMACTYRYNWSNADYSQCGFGYTSEFTLGISIYLKKSTSGRSELNPLWVNKWCCWNRTKKYCRRNLQGWTLIGILLPDTINTTLIRTSKLILPSVSNGKTIHLQLVTSH